jgi:type II secretory pathway predicted ATPase ExeA
MAHLATATERPDCLVAICGADGSGKTTLLNRYITSLGEDVCFATIDETCNGEKDFFCAFLKQLGFTEISGTSSELWRITKEFLVHRGMAGDPVLLIIDNAHLMRSRSIVAMS